MEEDALDENNVSLDMNEAPVEEAVENEGNAILVVEEGMDGTLAVEEAMEDNSLAINDAL